MQTKPPTKKAHNLRDKVDHQQHRLDEITKDLAHLRGLVEVARRQVKKEKEVLASLQNRLQVQMQMDEIPSNKVRWNGVYSQMLADGFTPKEVAAIQNQDCTFKQMGEILGVSPSRAGEILKKAHRKMLHYKRIQYFIDQGLVEMDDRARAVLEHGKRQEYLKKRVAVWRETGELLPLESDDA